MSKEVTLREAVINLLKAMEEVLDSADRIDSTQKKYAKSDKGKEAQQKYAQSDKGRGSRTSYLKSEKGKEAQLKYYMSEKGQTTRQQRNAIRKLLTKYDNYLKRTPDGTWEDFLNNLEDPEDGLQGIGVLPKP